MPKPLTRPELARPGTAAPPAAPVSWRIASVMPEEAAGGAGLARPTAGRRWCWWATCRRRSSVCARTNAGALALVAEAEVLELHHHDHRVVVVGLHEVDVVRAARRPCAYSSSRSTAQPPRIMIGSSRVGVVALDGAEHAHVGQAQVARARLAHHQERLGAGAGHHAVEQVDRVGDRPRAQVLVQRQRLLEQRVRDAAARCCAAPRRCLPKSSRVAP